MNDDQFGMHDDEVVGDVLEDEEEEDEESKASEEETI